MAEAEKAEDGPDSYSTVHGVAEVSNDSYSNDPEDAMTEDEQKKEEVDE
jgi:hypothetical protein